MRVAVVMCTLTALVLVVGCSKKEEPAPKAAAPVTPAPVTPAPVTVAPATAAQATEVKKLVEETKRYAQTLRAHPAGDRASAEHASKLPGLLEQLVRHMDERAQASQQGGDVAVPTAKVAEDLRQIQEVQSAFAATEDQPGTPAPAGQGKSPVDQINENLAKITQMAQQGADIVAILRSSKRQRGDAGSSESTSAEETPTADEAQASEPQESKQASEESESTTETASSADPEAESAGDTEPETKSTDRDRPVVVTAKLPVLKMPEMASASTCCSIVANPELKGRLGRLVVTYPEGTNAGAQIEVYMGDKRVTYAYGNKAFGLLPGTYSVVITGKRVDNVRVQSGHDTKVKVGVLRVTAPGDTLIEVLDKDRKTRLTYGYGSKQFGFLPGTVYVRVQGQSEAVAIQDGKITEF